jgi:putative aminopeptidase FrvX
MNSLPEINTERMQKLLLDLLTIPSPTGFSHRAIEFTRQAAEQIPGLTCQLTRKGALLIEIPGKHSDSPRALSAHVDTLGAMVKEIKADGRLKLFQVGGFAWNSVEGEDCTIHTSSGTTVRGSILIHHASGHVYGKEVNELKREDATMEVRVDAKTLSKAETEALGIKVGDFVSFNPRAEWINGFIRSRHLDDKAGVACLLEAITLLVEAEQQPEQQTYLYISNYEEVGHGAASGIPAEVQELISVDMAAIGEGQNSDEFHTTICKSDSTGPYDYTLSTRLVTLAEQNQISYKTDIYPHYGSDGSAFLAAGGNARVALIGPGVDASHHYERTHQDALAATTNLVLAYLLS